MLLVRLRVQKTRHAMNLFDRDGILAGDRGGRIERGVPKIVGRMQTRKGQAVDLTGDSTIPEIIESIDTKPHEVFIPEPEMNLEADGHFGIEDV